MLRPIIATKKREVEFLLAHHHLADWESAARNLPKPIGFESALRKASTTIKVIAEIKKASPSAGIIRADFRPVEHAQSYARAGATCLSVLTDQDFFQGHLDYLREVSKLSLLPTLRKDFIIHRAQILEARLAGASAVLLIAECLTRQELADLVGFANDLTLDTLVEFYDRDRLEDVIASGATLIGVNNRDLRTFKTNLQHTLDVLHDIPADCLLVSESGIKTNQDVARLWSAGVKAILVGESMMRADDPGTKLRELLS